MGFHDRRLRRAQYRIKQVVVADLYHVWTLNELCETTHLRRGILVEAIQQMINARQLNYLRDRRRGPSYIVSTEHREILEAELQTA